MIKLSKFWPNDFRKYVGMVVSLKKPIKSRYVLVASSPISWRTHCSAAVGSSRVWPNAYCMSSDLNLACFSDLSSCANTRSISCSKCGIWYLLLIISLSNSVENNEIFTLLFFLTVKTVSWKNILSFTVPIFAFNCSCNKRTLSFSLESSSWSRSRRPFCWVLFVSGLKSLLTI